MLIQTLDAIEKFPGLQKATDNFFGVLYRQIDEQIGEIQSTCRSCRRCCDFSTSGLNLYVTSLELAYFIMNAPRPSGPIIGRCPYLDDRTGCATRAVRPIGCRAYFCSPPARYNPQDLYESALNRVKEFIRKNNLPYQYAEWLHSLQCGIKLTCRGNPMWLPSSKSRDRVAPPPSAES